MIIKGEYRAWYNGNKFLSLRLPGKDIYFKNVKDELDIYSFATPFIDTTNWIVEPFTGMVLNGIKVYPNDILTCVESKGSDYIVEYIKEDLRYWLFNREHIAEFPVSFININKGYWIVKGNIHQV